MSRAKDSAIIKESQKVFKNIKTISAIIIMVLILITAYLLIIRKDHDEAIVRNINQEQARKTIERELSPYRERLNELKEKSGKQILSEAELKELDWLLVKTGEVKKEIREKYFKEKIPQVVQAKERRIEIPLLGEKILSKKIVDIDSAPAGWQYRFDGPSTAQVHFSDGTKGPITKDYGVKGGRIRFSGPVGQLVIVRFYP